MSRRVSSKRRRLFKYSHRRFPYIVTVRSRTPATMFHAEGGRARNSLSTFKQTAKYESSSSYEREKMRRRRPTKGDMRETRNVSIAGVNCPKIGPLRKVGGAKRAADKINKGRGTARVRQSNQFDSHSREIRTERTQNAGRGKRRREDKIGPDIDQN